MMLYLRRTLLLSVHYSATDIKHNCSEDETMPPLRDFKADKICFLLRFHAYGITEDV